MAPSRLSLPAALSALLIAACSCGAPQPANPPPRAVAAPPPAQPTPSGVTGEAQLQPLEAAVLAGPNTPNVGRDSPFHLVARSAVMTIDPYPFPGGAVLAGGSLLAIVLGDGIVQDPSFLAGLPEYINWEASVTLLLPTLAKPLEAASIPEGTTLDVLSGNRLDPGASLRWSGRGWSKGTAPRDPRMARLPRAQDDGREVTLALPSGHLAVVRSGGAGALAFTFAPGQLAPVISKILLENSDWSSAQLVAASPDHLYFCTDKGEVAELRDGTWRPVALPAKQPSSCAATSDGALWILAGFSKDAGLYRRSAQGDWAPVPTPGGVEPRRVAAAGDRVWISADTHLPTGSSSDVLSTAPVKISLEVTAHEKPSFSPAEDSTGSNQVSEETTSVAADPPGPGSSVCPSLVVYLAKRMTPALQDMLARQVPPTLDAQLVAVEGVAPGRVVPEVPGSAQMKHRPSGKNAPGFALLTQDHGAARRLVQALEPLMRDAPPRLLCAKPRVTRRLVAPWAAPQKAP